MNRIIGVESWKATWTPALALVAPGPRVTKAIAGPAGHLAVGVGHVGDAAFLPADDEVDLGRVVERVEHGEEAFARDREDAVAALDPELVDEDAVRRCAWSWRGVSRNGAASPAPTGLTADDALEIVPTADSIVGKKRSSPNSVNSPKRFNLSFTGSFISAKQSSMPSAFKLSASSAKRPTK